MEEERDELEALRLEVGLQESPGWGFRLKWITILFQQDADKLTFGKFDNDKERMQAEGRCQAYAMIMRRDDQLRKDWDEIQATERQTGEPETLEGGDFGVNYEAAQ